MSSSMMVQQQQQSFAPPNGNFGGGEVVKETLKFDPTAAGLIVGYRGATVKGLQREYGVSVTLNTQVPGELDVEGPAPNVQRCIERIKDLTNGGFQLDVPAASQAHYGVVALKKAEIQYTHNVRLVLKRDGTGFLLRGAQCAVENAKQHVDSLVGQQPENVTPTAIPGTVVQSIPFPGQMMGLVIGSGGSRLKDMQWRYHVQINCDGPQQLITITGPAEGVSMCITELQSISERGPPRF